jgi:adenylate cyclase
VKAHKPAALVFSLETALHHLVPDFSRSPVLGNFFEEIIMGIEEKTEARAEVVNIKSATLGVERDEYEYEIPVADADRMLATLAGSRVEKIRHLVKADRHLFEIDEFLGSNAGLVVAEIELTHAGETFPRPGWLGREVTELARYYNLNLATHPYSQWSAAERASLDAPGPRA